MACKTKQLYLQKNLQSAIKAVKGGKSVSAAAAEFGVPKSTLYGHMHGRIGSGAPTVLEHRDEQQSVITCPVLAEMGFGITRPLVERVVAEYVRENGIANPFANGTPGKDWWQRFMRRWPALAERKPQHLSKRRAQAANSECIKAFFDSLEKSFREGRLILDDPATSCHSWNCDETAFCTSASSSKLLCKRGAKSLHEVGGGTGREHITVHVCCSASGERLPPFILYKGKNLYERWMKGGSAGTVYGISDSGWMDSANFLSWFSKLFIPAVSHLTTSGPVYLFFDGHHSHISLGLIRVVNDNNIKLYCLPPNCTHILQPLDVGVFGPAKKAWPKILKKWKFESKAQIVSKEVFPGLMQELWATSLTPAHCRSGFRATGILPLSRDAVTGKLSPSDVFRSTEEQSPMQTLDHISCEACGHQMRASPHIRTNLRGYFRGVLEVKVRPTGTRSHTRVRVEGEVITSDEFVQLLEKEKQGKGRNKRTQLQETALMLTKKVHE